MIRAAWWESVVWSTVLAIPGALIVAAWLLR